MKNSILIAKHFSGDLTPDEKQEFAMWLHKDVRNEQTLAMYEKIWIAAGKTIHEIETDTEVEWKKFTVAIAGGTSVQRHVPIYQLYWRQAAAAAAVIIVVATAAVYSLPGKEVLPTISNAASSTSSPQFTAFSAGEEPGDFYLADSTHVFLNQNSSVTFLSSFSGPTRSTWLDGEAYFEVTKGERPFIVYAGGTQVSVLGTAFNIRIDDVNEKVELVVVEGKVAFRAQDAPAASEIILERNEMITFDQKENQVTESRAENSTHWWNKYKWNDKFNWTEKRDELFDKLKLKKK